MLKIIHSMKELDFSALMAVYEEGNMENAADLYPDLPEGQRLLRAEQDFYQYLRECFFPTQEAYYCVWNVGGQFASALRLEPYRDGLLLEALETAPALRRKGYAAALIQAVQARLGQQGGEKVYSHVGKRNEASLRTHESCGFRVVSDRAVYADGSVNDRCYTLLWDGK